MKDAGKASKRLGVNEAVSKLMADFLGPKAIAEIYLLPFSLLNSLRFIHIQFLEPSHVLLEFADKSRKDRAGVVRSFIMTVNCKMRRLQKNLCAHAIVKERAKENMSLGFW